MRRLRLHRLGRFPDLQLEDLDGVGAGVGQVQPPVVVIQGYSFRREERRAVVGGHLGLVEEAAVLVVQAEAVVPAVGDGDDPPVAVQGEGRAEAGGKAGKHPPPVVHVNHQAVLGQDPERAVVIHGHVGNLGVTAQVVAQGGVHLGQVAAPVELVEFLPGGYPQLAGPVRRQRPRHARRTADARKRVVVALEAAGARRGGVALRDDEGRGDVGELEHRPRGGVGQVHLVLVAHGEVGGAEGPLAAAEIVVVLLDNPPGGVEHLHPEVAHVQHHQVAEVVQGEVGGVDELAQAGAVVAPGVVVVHPHGAVGVQADVLLAGEPSAALQGELAGGQEEKRQDG